MTSIRITVIVNVSIVFVVIDVQKLNNKTYV